MSKGTTQHIFATFLLNKGLFFAAACSLVLITACGGGDDIQVTNLSSPTPTNTPAPLPYAVLYSFTGGADGANPEAALVSDGAGNFYGTTMNGGSSGKGTVFKITAAGVETALYSFSGGADGASPVAGLVRDGAGDFYGTTFSGGTSRNNGTVFKIDSSGVKTVLYRFAGGSDGSLPYGRLVSDGAGHFYGTTFRGGTSDYGTVFKITAAGAKTVLHNFADGADSVSPQANLVIDGAGNFYGTTAEGGTSGLGTVFKIDSGGVETVLHNFAGGADGSRPYAGLVSDGAGNFYGTTLEGGTSGLGTVFKIDSSGAATVLHSFAGGHGDGAGPGAALVRDGAGNFYGATVEGGTSNTGTVFKITSSGVITVLYSFAGGGDAANPIGGLLIDGGYLYGTTVNGGTSNQGTVFRLPMQ